MANASIVEIRGTVNRIEENGLRREEQIDQMQDAIARIEASNEADEKHTLRPRDLGGMHEKINLIAQDLANVKGKQDAQYLALREQLTLLQHTFNRSLRLKRPLSRTDT
jgi:hypothetical protein